jgi:hypothetical protein
METRGNWCLFDIMVILTFMAFSEIVSQIPDRVTNTPDVYGMTRAPSGRSDAPYDMDFYEDGYKYAK